MTSTLQPRVSIVTPVYNNAEYLPECIESVLAQTYQNWDYTIVDNCSIDGTAEIAHKYAARDGRIKVHENRTHLRVVANHNVAMRQISPESKYCKVVFGDDWIFPRCLEEMVTLAEEHPSVGVVGAYGLQDSELLWAGLSHKDRVVPGREICRRMFLDGLYVFGTPNSVLYRSAMVRDRNPFFDESNLLADREVCVALMKCSDFGFVHQVLTFKRLQPDALTPTVAWNLMAHFGCSLTTLMLHGRDFLDDKEFDGCLEHSLDEYYNFLAVSLLRGRRDKQFWDFQKRKLAETVGFSRSRLCGAVLSRSCRALLNPYETIQKVMGNSSRFAQEFREKRERNIPRVARPYREASSE